MHFSISSVGKAMDRYHRFFAIQLFLIGFALTGVFSLLFLTGFTTNAISGSESREDAVLGESSAAVIVRGSNNDYGVGGVISLASTDDPAIKIASYSSIGPIHVELYAADKAKLLSYLLYNDEDDQLNPNLDVSVMNKIYETDAEVSDRYDDEYVSLPLSESGIWYFVVKNNNLETHGMIVRSKHGILAKEGKSDLVFWGQNFDSRRSVSGGKVELYNVKNNVNVINTVVLGEDGLGTAPMVSNADIALSDRDGDIALVPLNLRYLNYGYSYARYRELEVGTKFFIFTDRPLYRPGDVVYYKAILRNDIDASYSLPSGEVEVGLYSSYGEEGLIEKRRLSLDEYGSTFGQFTIPDDGKTGSYYLRLEVDEDTYSYQYFNVQEFRKPEYFIDVEVDKQELIAGDVGQVRVHGEYFSGQPVTNDVVEYKIYSSSFGDYMYYGQRERALDDDYRVGYWNNTTVASGEATFGSDGNAVIDFEAVIPDDTEGKGKNNQIYSIEVNYDNGSGNPAFSRKNIIVFAGEYSLYRSENSQYMGKVGETFDAKMQLVGNVGDVDLNGVTVSANVVRHYWEEEQIEGQKYSSWHEKTEDYEPISAKTDKNGNVTLSFVPRSVGSYELRIEILDSNGNTINKQFYYYVSDQGYYYSGRSNGLTIAMDKDLYQPTDMATITISSETPDRDVLFSFDREYMHRYQIVHIDGNQKKIDVELEANDMPNIFASAQSFSGNYLDSSYEQLIVSPESQELLIDISSDQQRYGPGDDVRLTVKTTDYQGHPVASDLALWAVDKAIFELTGKVNYDIFSSFWNERYYSTTSSHSLEGITALMTERGGGCFDGETEILMADDVMKPIEEVAVGDVVLTRENEADARLVEAKVTDVHNVEVDGYLILNGDLKVTPEHRLWVNGEWQDAGSVQVGDLLTGLDGASVGVTSVEWVMGPFEVYNLEIEDKHTFFAGGVWVHNQKGDARDVFEDTAYWNPRVRTNADGIGEVSFKLPDNLTTWAIAAVGSTQHTLVGSDTHEIQVSKEVIVRPNLPNILRTGDTANLTALVQNFTDQERTFNVKMEWDGGQVNQAEQQGIVLGSHTSKSVSWEVFPETEGDSKIKVSAWDAQAEEVSDIVEYSFPVMAFGFEKRDVQVGRGNMSFDVVKQAQEVNPDKSFLGVSLSPTMLGALPEAMNYLVQYPYGCVEQTSSRLVPLLMVKQHPELFAEIAKDRDIDEMVEKGLNRLKTLQSSDGSWSWWSGAEKNNYVSAYVLELLKWAQDLGYDVDPLMVANAKYYFQQTVPSMGNDLVYKQYTAQLFDINDVSRDLIALDNLDTDVAALAVVTNFNNGFTDPQLNGLAYIESLAQKDGDYVYWSKGNDDRFGSHDASTAMVLKALMVAGGNDELISEGVRYLMRNRQQAYWSNTFATAKVLQALSLYSQYSDELSPNYSYRVKLDGKQVNAGVFNSTDQIVDIDLDYNNLSDDGSVVSVEMEGTGEMYSTLVLSEFITEEIKEDPHGLRIVRDYWSEDGKDLSEVKLGDTIYVKLSVIGKESAMNYGVIEDQLPAGMIPINTTFRNEQYGEKNSFGFRYSYGETTLTGKVLSLYRVNPRVESYTYKARVVSTGEFRIPPAYVGMMYSPDVYAYSDTQYMTITEDGIKFDHPPEIDSSVTEMVKDQLKTGIPPLGLLLIGLGVGLIGSVGGYWLYEKKKIHGKKHEEPTEIPEETQAE